MRISLLTGLTYLTVGLLLIATLEPVTAAGVSRSQQDEAARPGTGAWLNYDFVPGEQVFFFDDFTDDIVGNFARRLEFVSGNMEVAEWNGRRYLRAGDMARFRVKLGNTLPQRFTVEFDLVLPADNVVRMHAVVNGEVNEDNAHVTCGPNYSGIEGRVRATSDLGGLYESVMQCRAMADGGYLKVYVNDRRVANVPNANFPRSGAIEFTMPGSPDAPVLLTDLRIAASSTPILYEALLATGRVATQGILFDTGSDRLRPESTPTLKEIGTMLQKYADLRLLIEGHTDNVGDDASNQTLSERRAAAVMRYLIETFQIDPSRLESRGFGETRPIGTNDTPEGRQNNRRVELVKL